MGKREREREYDGRLLENSNTVKQCTRLYKGPKGEGRERDRRQMRKREMRSGEAGQRASTQGDKH